MAILLDRFLFSSWPLSSVESVVGSVTIYLGALLCLQVRNAFQFLLTYIPFLFLASSVLPVAYWRTQKWMRNRKSMQIRDLFVIHN